MANDHIQNQVVNGSGGATSEKQTLLSKTSSYGGTSLRQNHNNDDIEKQKQPSRVSLEGNLQASSHLKSGRGRSNINSTYHNLLNSLVSMLAPHHMLHTKRNRQSVVLAPDDVDLPPQTQLHGSSKLAANAYIASILRRNSVTDAAAAITEDSSAEAEDHNNDNAAAVVVDKAASAEEEASDFLLLETVSSTLGEAHTLKEIEREYLLKTQKTFYQDAVNFAEGSIPQSIIMAFCIGCVCGVVAYLYYFVLDSLLHLIWKDMPTKFVIGKWPENLYFLWIPLTSVTFSICCGLSIYYLGEPGDLAYTIKCVHEKGYKGTHHILPMVAASLFTILAGGSLGPEAPLVAICAATAGFLSRKVFKQTSKNVVRKHTLMGMAGALSAFFGVPLGGSLFALEVCSRFGIEYFEHLIEAIFAGEISVVVFRSLAGLPLEQIWADADTPPKVGEADPYMIVLGGVIGLLGAGVAFLWANFHWRLMDGFGKLGLLDDENIYAVPRVLVGAAGVVTIGMLVPQTMFWGEWEFPVLATLSPASDLPHLWPTSGLIGFEMNSCRNCFIVGFCKLLAISFTVAGGYRGGYIFSFYTAGAAFGRALCFVFPKLSSVIATLCFAAGINVAITRTALATSLILAFLAGEQLALPAVMTASVVSLFATSYTPFIKSQIARSDIDFSLYYQGKCNNI